MGAKLNNIIEVMNYSIGKIWNRRCKKAMFYPPHKLELKMLNLYCPLGYDSLIVASRYLVICSHIARRAWPRVFQSNF